MSAWTNFHLFSLSFSDPFLFFLSSPSSSLPSPSVLLCQGPQCRRRYSGAADMVRWFKERHRPYEGGSVHMVEGENRKTEEEVKQKAPLPEITFVGGQRRHLCCFE